MVICPEVTEIDWEPTLFPAIGYDAFCELVAQFSSSAQ